VLGRRGCNRHDDEPEARGKRGTTEGVLGRSSILSSRERSSPLGQSLGGKNGGTILVRRVKPTTRTLEGARGGSCRSAWNRPGGARGRHGTSEDGTISVKAPPAVALGRPSAGGQHPERCEALPYRKARVRFQRWRCKRRHHGKRVHRGRIGQSGRKRIAASPLPGSGRANGSGPG